MLAYDKQNISSVRHFDDNGFLHVDVCNITKEQVAPYYGREIPGWQELGLVPDKIYYGYRPFEELEKAADTFNNLNLLSEHIEDGVDKDVQKFKIGSLGTDAKTSAPYLQNSLMIDNKEAIEDIESGRKKELSCAYRYDPVFKPGIFDGKRYDFRMENISGNHIALVREGRAGSDVVVADSNSIKKGEKMSTKIKEFISKISSKKNMAMDEDLEEALKEAIREEVKEIVPEVNNEEEVNEDADGTDKNALKNEVMERVNGLLKGRGEVDGKSEEDWYKWFREALDRLSYTESTRQAADKCPAKDEEPEDKAKENKEVKKEEKKDAPAMDAASIRLSIMNEFKSKNEAAADVRPLIGTVDPMAFDSAEDIYGKALELNGYNIKDYSRASYRGMVEVLKKTKSEKSGMSFDSASTSGVLTQFPELGKIKLGA